MATKAELIGQIEALETELTSSGVDYVKADTKGTNAELEQEIDRLESLIPDEDASSKSESKATSTAIQDEGQGDESKVKEAQSESGERKVKINKGVNVQIRIDGQRLVLKSEQEYSLPADRAQSIVAEKHGLYVDGI